MSRTRLYRCWADIKARCLNSKHKWYSYYGGRGISVCNEWLEFEPFMEWAFANGYNDSLTIDRINNDGNYEPLNCKWSTQQEQSLNKKHLKSKSGFVGVRWRKDAKKYQAEVFDHCRYYYVGLFDSAIDAFNARELFIKEHHLHGA